MDRYRMFAFGSGQGAVGFQRLELTAAIVGTTGYPLQGTGGLNISEVMVSKLENKRLPLQRTSNSQRLKLMVPNVGTKGYHDQVPEVRIYTFKAKGQSL